MTGDLLLSKQRPGLPDPISAIAEALAHPHASPPLQELARRGDRVCLVFTDATRASPDHLLVPPILQALSEAGIADEDITLLCGLGMHRASTPQEKAAKLSQEIVECYRVLDSEPRNPEQLVELGTTASGAPILVNRMACEADLLIATGIVEPHQYAGYSGGRKTLAIGAGGEALIRYTHSPRFLDDPGTRLGRIEGNPFHEAIAEVARRASLRFIANVVLNDRGEIIAVQAGEPEAAFAELVAIAADLYMQPIPHSYEIAVAGVGYPKDANLYQASRAATYLYFAPTPVVRQGGVIILPARAQEGAGRGIGEQRCYRALADAPNAKSLLAELRSRPFLAGEQRAYMIAQTLAHCQIIIVGAECPEVVREMKMIPAQDMQEAFEIAARYVGGRANVLVVPHALLTLPVVTAEKKL